MKTTMRFLLVTLPLIVASVVYAAEAPALDVTVSDANGKVAFKGRTASNGTFSTGKVGAGNYVVQFNSRAGAPSGQYALVVSAGKKKVSADAVDGGRFAKGGVAMKLDGVGAGTNISGQVVNAAALANNPNVKIIKGKRYVWVKSSTGSNLGGQWVEEGSPEARNVQRWDRDALTKIQAHDDIHQEGFPKNGH